MVWLWGVMVFCLVLSFARRAMAKEHTVLYTSEEIAAARENIERFDWAKKERDRVLAICQPWIERSDEEIWSLVTGQSIPRGIHVNPDLGCPSCGREVYRFGSYPWKISLDRPWKLECPACGEVWPKNDFGAFYKSGLGIGGVFDRKRADDTLFYNVEAGEGDPKRHFAVDDGMGWIDEKGNRWWFIAFYSHYCTWAELPKAAHALGLAYLYTGDPMYAHKGALLLDRIADVYPDMDLAPYSKLDLYNSHGGTGNGRIQGCIWETGVAETLALAYDMVYDGMVGNDPLVTFLSGKAAQWQIKNDKSNVARIRENIETNLLKEFVASCRDGRISGNEGMTHTAMATAAAVLDDPVETPKAIDWLFEPGKRGGHGGGHIEATLIGEVDRDGVGNEAAPGYCFIWMNQFYRCAQVLEKTRKYRDCDLHRDFPRLRRMYEVPYHITALDRYTPHIGDTGKTGDPGMASVNLDMAVAWFKQFEDAFFAQLAFMLNGNRTDGLHTEIWDANPEAVQDNIQRVVNQEGSLELGSANMNGYGFTVFRRGAGENRRVAYLYYGRNGGHGHRDQLNFGMYYRGMDILPDLGYPEYADGKWPKRAGWTLNTISHNTVMVNRQHQKINWVGHCLGYAASDGVGFVEVASPQVYPDTQDYRRTFAMVDVSETESYLVDFFRVAGGNDHVLSFHAGEGDVETHGVTFVEQPEGTYAGTDIPFGKHFDGAPDGRYTGSGFSYLYGVQRAQNPEKGWFADWTLRDTWGTQIGDGPVHVRFHALSVVDDASMAWGDPPQNKPGNPRRLRYGLLHNAGDNQRSLFVSVVEPYCGKDPNLKTVSRVDLGLAEDDLTAGAVCVVSESGQTDLIWSSDDPARIFDIGCGVRVAGKFGVVSLKNGKPISIFVVGGQRVETPAGVLKIEQARYKGVIKDFHKEEKGPAWMVVTGDVPAEAVGAQVRVLNDGVRDACYTIQNVAKHPDGLLLDLGETSFVRGLKSLENYSLGYTYDIAVGDQFEILSVVHIRVSSADVLPIVATSTWTWSN